MKIFNSLDEIKDLEPTAVALGNFDGIHLGHQELIKKAVEKAKADGLKAAVFTFSNHPRNMLPKAKKVKISFLLMKKHRFLNHLAWIICSILSSLRPL